MLKLRRGPIASYNLHYKLHHLNIITLEYSSKQYLYFLPLKTASWTHKEIFGAEFASFERFFATAY